MSENGDSPQSDDRRLEDRAAITLRVDYKRLNTFFADYTKNISKGGTFIRTSKPLDVGTEFVFVLSFPGRDEQLKLHGKVVWITSEADADESKDRPPGMGIRFIFQNDSEQTAIHDIVEHMMGETLGEHISAKLLHAKKS
jgi:type IV pilus assembly protein PilZ